MIRVYLKLLRPRQWIKNLLLLFPPFFAGKLFSHELLSHVLPSLAAFALVSSCGYVVNDLVDANDDKKHEIKKQRGVASGRIPLAGAMLTAVVLFIGSLAVAFHPVNGGNAFRWFVLLYFINSVLYSLLLKNIVIIDILTIASGFLLRVLAGGEIFRTPVSNWLFLTVFAVALLLASGKRLGELVYSSGSAHYHRKILSEYTHSFLEGILWFSAASSCVMYSLYTLERINGLLYTVPVVTFGLLRYIFLVKKGKGDPTEVLFGDRQIMGVGILWLSMIGIIIY